ncbi:type I 3-dehydroquinate dehydratase [Sporolituus thermophilus]|uniref:3-dehydroquinate dehydratase n=1 Tax=Sporolituus thermophilus DSM 23256 TaxID=1123285 RepID=A0A1G7LA55_9FIRM|nr:type I 3-dehydroquinate dehydratase [Sporolituus thermophilus]SDF46417.1 3-dehydroquinate dehydratase [Sporolituus thermophilus DSM 23256]
MNNTMIGQGTKPLICVPLVGRTGDAVMAELSEVLVKKPDVIEWRADFFGDISQSDEVIRIANWIKKAAGDIPFIFTVRSRREGGQPITLNDHDILELLINICQNTGWEYIDYELSNPPAYIECLRTVALKTKKKIIGSFHDFEGTPAADILLQKFAQAVQYQLDVAKVAVMPRTLEDVLALLQVTLAAKRLVNIPIITISMGRYGVISRMIGGVFGSALSFAIGANSSAPGQIQIDDLRTVLTVIEKAIGASNN